MDSLVNTAVSDSSEVNITDRVAAMGISNDAAYVAPDAHPVLDAQAASKVDIPSVLDDEIGSKEPSAVVDGGTVPKSPRSVAMQKRSIVPPVIAGSPGSKKIGEKVKIGAGDASKTVRATKRVAGTDKQSGAAAKTLVSKGKDAAVKEKKGAATARKSPRKTKKKAVRFKDNDSDFEEAKEDDPDEPDDLSQYKFVKRGGKRKRGTKGLLDGESEPANKKRFNTTTRCSLKELHICLALLKNRHLELLKAGGLGHLPKITVKSNINRRLICFLMYKINTHTMILDLGDGHRKLQINAYAIEKLFGLPRGRNSAPRPSDNGNDEAVMQLKAELGLPRNKHINTRFLRKKLTKLVEDKTKDVLVMKVFGLIFYMKFICPGYSVRVSREASMVQEKSIAELKDVDLCQLLVDELKMATIAWQKADADWRAVPGCCIVPLLMYLDVLNHRKLNKKNDRRTPRALFFDPLNLKELADLDCLVEGTKDPRSWIFGALPWKTYDEIIYIEQSSKATFSTLPSSIRTSPLKRSACFSGEPSSKRFFTGSTSAAGVEAEGSGINVYANVFSRFDHHLSEALKLSSQIPTTCTRLKFTSGLLPSGHSFDQEAMKEDLDLEAINIAQMQSSLSQMCSTFFMLKSIQDRRCKPYEDEAQRYLDDMKKADDGGAHQMQDTVETATNDDAAVHSPARSPVIAADIPESPPIDSDKTVSDDPQPEETSDGRLADTATHPTVAEDSVPAVPVVEEPKHAQDASGEDAHVQPDAAHVQPGASTDLPGGEPVDAHPGADGLHSVYQDEKEIPSKPDAVDAVVTPSSSAQDIDGVGNKQNKSPPKVAKNVVFSSDKISKPEQLVQSTKETIVVSQKNSQQYDEASLNVGLHAGDALTVPGSKTTVEQEQLMDESAVKEKLQEKINAPTETTGLQSMDGSDASACLQVVKVDKVKEDHQFRRKQLESDQAKIDDTTSHLESNNIFQDTGCDKIIIDKMPETDPDPRSFETVQHAQNEYTSKLCITEMDQKNHPPDAANSLKLSAETEDTLNQEVQNKEEEPVEEELQNTTEDIGK